MKNLTKYVKDYFTKKSKNGAHGYDHALRVHNLGRYIAEHENADLEIVRAACLLHDIGKSYETKGTCHAEIGAQIAKEILKELNFSNEKIPMVVYCIEVHRYSSGITPTTLEAKIIQDADRLEEIGAIAIARGLIEDKLKGKPLYDPNIPQNKTYKTGKNKTSINFLKEKSLKLKPEIFHTKTAQSLAKERYEFTEQFVKRVIEEWKI